MIEGRIETEQTARRGNAGRRAVGTLLIMVMTATLLLTGCASKAAKAQTKADELLASGNYTEAVTQLNTIVSAADQTKADEVLLLINAYYTLGDCYKNLGQADKAGENYDKALEADTKDWDFTIEQTSTRCLRRGLVYVSKEDYASALSSFQAGLACQEVTYTKELTRNEIICYENLGNWENAKNALASYVAAYPEDEEMSKEYTFLQTRI